MNGRVLTLDPRHPRAEAIAVQGERILAAGQMVDILALCGSSTEVVDVEGGMIIPAFHDAHVHLLSYARFRSRVDCSGLRSIARITAAIAERARGAQPGAWVRAVGYDDAILAEGRHPDRRDLDAATGEHPVRLQHRTLHLDVLNTRGLEYLGLLDNSGPEVERDPETGAATGRLYHAAELLRARWQDPVTAGTIGAQDRDPGHADTGPWDDLSADVRAASEELLRRGVTTVQDATFTNGPAEWALFKRLVATGDLGVRLVMFQGMRAWGELQEASEAESLTGLLLGPVKVMLEETRSDPGEVRAAVEAGRRAGLAVAFHAVRESEVAMALGALADAPARSRVPSVPPSARGQDRLEHGAVIPDALLGDLRATGAMVVGQPALVYERGELYLDEYRPETHGWLHRAGSIVRSGVRYAAGSDAPVTDPSPVLSLYAARRRRTSGGRLLGSMEVLGPTAALAVHTLAPAQAVGLEHELGRVRKGARADLVVLDPEVIEAQTVPAPVGWTRLTIKDGRIVWRRP